MAVEKIRLTKQHKDSKVFFGLTNFSCCLIFRLIVLLNVHSMGKLYTYSILYAYNHLQYPTQQLAKYIGMLSGYFKWNFLRQIENV